ncbi:MULTISPECIES: Bax inhibitor-1/YccA family protein [Streptomyces]|uniref:Bax inhibitor-1/YccA family protein n=1 Tax=Streptomyces glycanivorans TaxID=3033808 RepID=A0ABY9JDY5_9ACTN|nr:MULTISPECIES: Bax inhibitor-1/YccA family protein [unclassified Streptomyces]WSQ79428.1 Bax inhibitor-1/YccA family protein [Streptomyces sp. NBC_01213]TXS09332.1 Bax inhibitor-1/YccA family protein [Streptomyces sp. wa22]WLQ65988.1 Bax inhibitor-1/YccA family protein [Streptomyces sp. Alt3]WSQ86809.1 Bax inhibitor-1/YccA family protein [Streptomyces sp. NBC_01212]WSR07174.1 Bax inhibitor-1/YccA family protein [Streptomyces sp. NBC_01208]
MRSSNPVFSRRGFSRDNGYAGFNAAPQAGAATAGTNPYAQGTANPYATNPYAQQDTQYGAPQAPARSGAMTIDDVVTRTAMTLGTVVLTAALSWALLPVDEASLGKSYGIAIGAALVAFVFAMIQSFKRKASPAIILAYAAFEGVFLGVISSAVSTYIGPGTVMQAVMGTMCVFAGVLIAYKMRWIRVTRRFYGFVMAAAMGFMLLMVVNLLFSVFGGGDGLGFRSGGLGILFGVIGIILGACFLALDFKQVEDGVNFGAPREEAWLAAFGLTMTLVWIYLEMLRLLSILNGDD